ncbi:MAG: TIGR03086 family metal-binding protein [Acidimicrobiales bacterium]
MTNSSTPAQDDPRFGFAEVTEIVGQLIESIEAMDPEVLTRSTPCPDFTVSELIDHVVMVMRRVAVVGNGEHFGTVQQAPLGSDRVGHYRSAAHDVMAAWTDPAKLEQMFDVPWGRFPGGPVLFSYTGELAVHGWDLAVATEQPITIDDDVLGGALMAAKFIPAEGRNEPEMPFDPVVDPGSDAPVLDQLAGWLGRQVIPA